MKISFITAVLVITSCFAGCFALAQAQGQTKSRVFEISLVPQNPVPELQQVAALQATVSLEAKQMPLTDLLTALQKQSGVVFQSGADFPSAKTRVTLRLKDMTLASLMGTLSRIYGVRWVEEKGGWTMRASDQSTLTIQLMRSIGIDGRFTMEKMKIAEQQRAELVEEIYGSVDEAAWRSPEGVPFASLPEEVQQHIRDAVSERQWQPTIERQLERIQLSQQKLVLRLGKIALDATPLFANDVSLLNFNPLSVLDSTQLAIYTADGRFVTNIFPTFQPSAEPPAPPANAAAATPAAR